MFPPTRSCPGPSILHLEQTLVAVSLVPTCRLLISNAQLMRTAFRVTRQASIPLYDCFAAA